jgi:hypothetical protein
MRKILAALMLLAVIVPIMWPASAIARASGYVNPNYHWVPPYQRRDGTRVRGHFKTDSNRTKCDNYSTEGNVNPHTGQPGTKRVC